MNKCKTLPKRIGLVIEGTYPYVSGGVATWIHQIISEFKEFDFYLIVILAKKEDAGEMRYSLPENVKGLFHVFLQEYPEKPMFLPKKFTGINLVKKFLENYSYERFVNLVKFYYNLPDKKKIVTEGLYSLDTFNILQNIYMKLPDDRGFINYFWIMRSLIVNLLNIFAVTPPECKIIHTISTGFAGLLSTVMKIANPESHLMLTEHGIYTRERDIEISVGIWPDTDPNQYVPEEGIGPLKKIWRETFFYLSKVCYETCDNIYTLHEKNRNIQVEQGAAPEKIEIIRNGINLEMYEFRKRDSMSNPPVIGFLGRIVKIKDVKTLIRSAKIVCQKVPNAVFKIAGPYDEDPEYFEECKELVRILLLEKNVFFLGRVNAKDFFNEIDLIVLTSISEGQPLVIAEAASCGVPCVATDVGGCKEMLYGGGDDNLGQSGIVAEQANTDKIADAILRFIGDKRFYSLCSENGRLRAEKFYDENILFEKYRKIYSKYLQ